MLKKVIKIIIVILLVIIVIGGILLKMIKSNFDQITLQYDNEVVSELKTELNFIAYEESLKELKPLRMQEVEDLVYEKSIVEIQNSIKSNKLKCQEVVLYYIDRIKTYDSKYNTVISINPKALEYAKELDKRIENGEVVGELFGVVALLKDNISDKDMPTTAGSYALRNTTTNRDAYVVEILKEKDAIVIGKNNLSEWANFMSMPSSNGFSTLGGQTKHAYGKFDVGGSSSGSSASVALNFATISLGSETAGSVIYPASQNSVVAIKPTVGLLSRDLVIPISEAQDTIGIIGKNAEDVYLVLENLKAYDSRDEITLISKDFNLKPLSKEKLNLEGFKIGVYKQTYYQKIAEELKSLGAEVKIIELEGKSEELEYLPVLNYGIVNDVAAYLNNPAVSSEFKSLKEILDYSKEDADRRMPYGAKLHEDALTQKMSVEEYDDLVKNNRTLASKIIDDILEKQDLDCIVSTSNELSGVYAPANYPAVTVPAGYNEDGEPFGVTFVGKKLSDDILLQIAYIYENGMNHRIAPKISNK